jgi:hypothetical protein
MANEKYMTSDDEMMDHYLRAQPNALAPTVADLIDDAIAKGLVFTYVDYGSGVVVTGPRTFPEEDWQPIKDVAPAARLLIKLRYLSEWLTFDNQMFVHGESLTDDAEWAKWRHVFVAMDRMIRKLYGLKGCLFGKRGCGDAAALCAACGKRKILND